jgi:class 3 adenylate cyclase
MTQKTIVELDLVGYSDVARALEENLDAEIVGKFNDQIQEFVNSGLKAVGVTRRNAVRATTGDGAILVFDDPADAHKFAVEVHKSTQEHNRQKTLPSAQRWFRIGIATGELSQRARADGGREIAGTVIANAVRLEGAARPGQIVIDDTTFKWTAQDQYGPAETVPGKRTERFEVRRSTIVQYSSSDEATVTVNSILELFDRLNPPDQVDRLAILLKVPQEHRPSKIASPFQRNNAMLEWAERAGPDGLQKLAAGLKQLISRQEVPRK